jgi:hypothetical protein
MRSPEEHCWIRKNTIEMRLKGRKWKNRGKGMR